MTLGVYPITTMYHLKGQRPQNLPLEGHPEMVGSPADPYASPVSTPGAVVYPSRRPPPRYYHPQSSPVPSPHTQVHPSPLFLFLTEMVYT